MRHTLKQLGVKAVVALSVGLSAWTSSEAQQLIWISPVSIADSRPSISGDGKTVVFESATGRQAIRWSEESGMSVICFSCKPEAVSRDGSVVAGTIYTYEGVRGFVWRNGDMELLVAPNGADTEAYDISADGLAVIGRYACQFGWCGFRWTPSEGMQSFGSWARVVSGDGRVIFSRNGDRWVGGAYTGNIGFVPQDASFDGTVAVGFGGTIGYYWSETGGRIQIPNTLGGAGSYPYGVSGDGRIVVGSAMNDHVRSRAFRWRPGEGMEDLNFVYGRLLGGGESFVSGTGISESGRYIVGFGLRGTTYWAFRLDTCTHGADVFEDGCVDDVDLLLVLLRFGHSGARAGRADVDCDGTVSDADLLTVLFNFGNGC